MKCLNIVRKIVKLPFVIIVSPFILLAVFITTNWESEWDIEITKKMLRGWFW